MIPISSIVGKMIETRERVLFTDCDPYGHMGSAAYLVKAINHRLSAVTHQLGFDTLHAAQNLGVAFVNKEMHMDFRASALFDEELVVRSWIDRCRGYRMIVVVLILRASNQELLCQITAESVTVNLAEGGLVPIPPEYHPSNPVQLDLLPWAPGHPRAPGEDKGRRRLMTPQEEP